MRPPPGYSWTCLTRHPPATAVAMPGFSSRFDRDGESRPGENMGLAQRGEKQAHKMKEKSKKSHHMTKATVAPPIQSKLDVLQRI
ncbi:hypothetical protein HHI36_002566 [Cryptolaemus montrouzieri]|uniref:Uncharacterized protein n=1 Tax=Cryptolaemus montrouzieri TaxID=559131 RepID=A0ABD2PBP6_9CUCU